MQLFSRSKIAKQISKFFTSEEDGAVAVIFAVMLIPVVALSGAAIDYSEATNVRTQMQKSSDAAALAAGRAAENNDNERELLQIAQGVFDENMANSGFAGTMRLRGQTTARGYVVEVASEAPTSFLKLVGVENLSVSVRTEVGIPQLIENPPPPPPPPPGNNNAKLEVVMSYHISNSIDLGSLKSGSRDLIDTLMQGNTGDDVKIGLVPFYKYVNIGSGNTGSWLDRSTFISSGTWIGCVGTRDGHYEVNDGGYSGSNRARGMVEHSAYCGAALTPLTTNRGTITSAVSTMRKHNKSWAEYTHFPVGLMWGWAVLSEGVPFTQGLPYHEDNKKVMIFVNDRVQNRSHNNGDAGSWGHSVSAANTEARRICANAKAQGIIIYTIRVNNTDAALKTTMDSCASAGKNYYASSGGQLESRLESIAEELEDLIEDNDPPPPPPPPPADVYEGELRIVR